MTLEGKMRFKEERSNMLAWVQTVNPAELLGILRDTGLANELLVRNYDKPNAPAYFQKEQDLRRLAYSHLKGHKDFHRRLFKLVGDKMVPRPTTPPAPAAPKKKGS